MVVLLAIGLGIGLGIDWSGSNDSEVSYPKIDCNGKCKVTVETNYGKIEGYQYDSEDEEYNGIPANNLFPNFKHNTTYFLGIPYAAPPVDNLRIWS